jgi:hypothetical protein
MNLSGHTDDLQSEFQEDGYETSDTLHYLNTAAFRLRDLSGTQNGLHRRRRDHRRSGGRGCGQ